MKDLTISDYKAVLYYYNIEIDTLSKKQIITQAEYILANKLCRCIKKINSQKKNEVRSIAICKNSIFKKKGLTLSKFKCKKNPMLLPFNKSKKNLKKIKRKLTLRKYKKSI